MLYKNKKNILRGVVAFVFMLTLSLSTALSPLAKAEEAKYTWKTLTTVPDTNDLKEIYISSDGSKLFVAGSNATHNTNLWMSADNGAAWRKIFSKQILVTTFMEDVLISTDGSKIVLRYGDYFGISTDGGQSWSERGLSPAFAGALISPDGSFLVGCSGHTASGYIIYISTDDGQTWTQKGTNNVSCALNVFNNGTLIAPAYDGMAKSTDYGQTWTETPGVLSDGRQTAFSNNGNYIFDVDRISLDGGNHWTSLNPPIPAGPNYPVYRTGISDDGKKLFINTESIFLTSVDGGRTWHSEDLLKSDTVMSNDGSKLFNVYEDNNGRLVYRMGILPTSQPVTPGSGAGGAATPSASTSATPGQKPGKASGRLAETGTSTWTVGGLAVVAVAAGALVLRKRL